jgi:hypothetical protein
MAAMVLLWRPACFGGGFGVGLRGRAGRSRAVVVRAVGDGRADDSAALQGAIDAAAAKDGGGLVFLPSGRYRISKTLFLWPGVRCSGSARPVR